jgi:hypothetical protein
VRRGFFKVPPGYPGNPRPEHAEAQMGCHRIEIARFGLSAANLLLALREAGLDFPSARIAFDDLRYGQVEGGDQQGGASGAWRGGEAAARKGLGASSTALHRG